ncbi:inactive protein kinase SELMODRAFT_444075 [Ziziphus jujuba]|uniref:Inactive protein kinase SELMODRAFT_444075 n=1 Tax=Ziziphus jujuba TaxID=326968 RepID=A0A6P4A6Q1_ZIZJJ|nr:inactive protein kinase SELMODRAFT_444075 [Ziziphus jujuba]XP_024931944.2 inactive protein kinase SELMODRAFT_444075 [Ziziphus jujuba]
MKHKGGSDHVVGAGKVVVVAVKASKEISKAALVWALTHVVQPGDCIKLLVVIPSQTSSKRMWDFSRFTSDCAFGHHKSFSGGANSFETDDIVNSCSQMVLQLHNVYDPEKVKVRIKIVSGSPCGGVVAAEAKRIQSNWVILDKLLKYEKKYCMEELQCNIVVMRRSEPKVLRLNFINSPKMEPEMICPLLSESEACSDHFISKFEGSNMIRVPAVTPASSPEHESLLTRTDVGTSSISSSSDLGTSPLLLSGAHRSLKREYHKHLTESDSDTNSEKLSSSFSSSFFQPWMTDFLSASNELSKHMVEGSERPYDKCLMSAYGSLLENLSKLDREPDVGVLNYRLDLNLSRSVREAISLSTNVPPGPPPLCSICQHKAPAFGNPPRWFNYAELELATGGFSQVNFLAEGGFGSVYRGVLPDGQVVAVKQYKLASSQGDLEFCSEVEVLSCAQHRNVVMLIGFCVEDGRRLLVYEYICNGSLDSHLYGQDQDLLEWAARQKIAVGAARGLRYLHEECRVGCIVHRDMRPNNILLTHDFEPLVGDFGLARWQPDGEKEVETRVLGTFGYLAPEYAQSGQITEKADVYSFGVVLVELVTGRKAVDINRPKGQQCLTEWARPLLEKLAVEEMIDPRLRKCFSKQEVDKMLQCASLCIRRDPLTRPRMSQVLRILEGDTAMNNPINSC